MNRVPPGLINYENQMDEFAREERLRKILPVDEVADYANRMVPENSVSVFIYVLASVAFLVGILVGFCLKGCV